MIVVDDMRAIVGDLCDLCGLLRGRLLWCLFLLRLCS